MGQPGSGRSEIGQWVGDRYRIDAFVGKGAFGRVFKAWDAKLDREVALKVLSATSERARQRFLREIKTTARLQHPHIVSTYDGGLVGESPYLVMAFLDGTPLESLASGGQVVAPHHAARWLADVAGAIQLAHEMGVVHRDIKPANIMIDKQGKAYVLDFGVASLRETADAQRLTQDGSRVGTPAYMAPEQLHGQPASERSDVYGLGATLYQALTANVPLPAVATGTMPRPVELVEGIPPELDAICMRCLERNPSERFTSAGELSQELLAYLHAKPEEAPNRTPILLAAVGGALLVAIVGGAGIALTGSTQGKSGSGTSPDSVETPAGPDPVAREEALHEARALASKEAPFELVAQALDRARIASAGDEALVEGVAEEGRRLEAPYALKEAGALAHGRAPLAEAVARLEAAAVDPALRDRARLEQLRLYVRRRRPEEAAPLVESLSSLEGPAGREARLLGALALEQGGEVEASLEALQVVASDDPDSAHGTCAQALRCVILGEHVGAAEEAAVALEIQEDMELARFALGRALVQLGETVRAADELGKVLAARPDWVDAHLTLAQLLARQARGESDLQRAREALEAALSLAANPPPGALRLRGWLHLQAGSLEPARASFDAALEEDRRDVMALLLRGFARQDLGESEGAARDWRRAREVDVLQFTRYARELTTGQRSRLETALKLKLPPAGLPYPQAKDSPAVKKTIAARVAAVPENARGEIEAALQLAAQGAEWEQLELHLQRAARAAPDSAEVALERVRLLVGRDRDGLALEAVLTARELGASAREVDRWQAETYLRRNDIDRALRVYRALAKADPNGVQGCVAAAEVAWQSGDPRASLQHAKRALELDPEDGPSLVVHGIALIYLGRAKDALEPLARAMELSGAINARALLMHAVARAEVVLKSERSSRAQRIEVLLEFERLRRITRGVAARVIGAKYALRMPGTLQWSREVLDQARAFRPHLAQTYLLLGLHGIKTRARRAQVISFWKQARERDPKLKIPPPLRSAFSGAYGDVDLDALLD